MTEAALEPTLRRILVPTDFSDCSRAALDYALFIAEAFDARIDLLHVWELPAYIPAEAIVGASGANVQTLSQVAQAHAADQMQSLVASLAAGRPRIDKTLLEIGAPARTISETARSGYDLIVLGTHGRSGFSRFLAGSVAEGVVRTAPCPVLSLRGSS